MAVPSGLRTSFSIATANWGGYIVGTDDVTPSALAAIDINIFTDLAFVNFALVGTARARVNGAYNAGRLWVPNRGELVLKPGDLVAVDGITGWPILLSADAAANGGGVVHN